MRVTHSGITERNRKEIYLRAMTTALSLVLIAVMALVALVAQAAPQASPPAPPSYNATLAMTGWYYSKAAFCDRDVLANWTCPTCPANPDLVDVGVFHNETTGGQAFVGYNTDTNTVVWSFRGSADIQNWINNLDFFFTDYPNPQCTSFSGTQCQVHRGFLNVYMSIRAPLLAHASALWTKYAGDHTSVLVTGHSLGGALAILGAVDATEMYNGKTVSEIAVYTYGEPRVGNPAWAKWVSEDVLVGGKQYRLTHEADPVPRLPPLEFGFLHVPHEVWYNNDDAGNTYTFCLDNATAEDYTNCENTQYAFDTTDHLLYLGVKAGCTTV